MLTIRRSLWRGLVKDLRVTKKGGSFDTRLGEPSQVPSFKLWISPAKFKSQDNPLSLQEILFLASILF